MKKISTLIFGILERNSYKRMVAVFFVIATVVPMILLQIISYGYLKGSFQKNVDELSEANVAKTRSNIESALNAYEDILYQVYTNDEIIENIDNIDRDENLAMNMNRLRRQLRTMCYAKDSIEAVSIITPEGNLIHYDKLTASSVNSSWVNSVEKTRTEIYTMGMRDFDTHILPTHFARKQLNKSNYLFHLVHRVIDYRNTDRPCGVAILSLNEDLLQEICKEDEVQNSYSYIVDEVGRVISHEDKEQIGMMISMPSGETFTGQASGKGATYISEPIRGWRVITEYNQESFWQDLSRQLGRFLGIGIAITLFALVMVIFITTLLSRSMNSVIAAMRQAQEGDLSVSVTKRHVVSSEMMSIVDTFNKMMTKIAELLEEVKLTAGRRRDAEIKALEAQVNPHFLYNILDSMNWMAIDNDQFEISHMITSLAKILRYSINSSNASVPLKDELEWVRQYIYLQSIRFKDDFEYIIEVEQEELLNFTIHKLLLQPFIENAVVHGFKDSQRKKILRIHIRQAPEGIEIEIHDNGKGIEEGVLQEILTKAENAGDHIGMANAIGRIHMYYGEESDVSVESSVGLGTTVSICIKSDGGVLK